jgi:ubiquinone/menaquinone biosynthesis C-methylase UbiE
MTTQGRAGYVSMDLIKSDFDLIASLLFENSDRDNVYHKYLLKRVPAHCQNALDVGCGTGAFSRLLATRSDRVLGLDLSPGMIDVARQRSRKHSNVSFEVADVLKMDFPSQEFDCIASINTLHHLPTEEVLLMIRKALRVNGKLIIHDLFQSEGVGDFITSTVAFPFNVGLRLVKTGRLRPPRELRRAWAQHGLNDTYLTMKQIRKICEKLLPGAQVRKHLLWQYSITWTKEPGR